MLGTQTAVDAAAEYFDAYFRQQGQPTIEERGQALEARERIFAPRHLYTALTTYGKYGTRNTQIFGDQEFASNEPLRRYDAEEGIKSGAGQVVLARLAEARFCGTDKGV